MGYVLALGHRWPRICTVYPINFHSYIHILYKWMNDGPSFPSLSSFCFPAAASWLSRAAIIYEENCWNLPDTGQTFWLAPKCFKRQTLGYTMNEPLKMIPRLLEEHKLYLTGPSTPEGTCNADCNWPKWCWCNDYKTVHFRNYCTRRHWLITPRDS
jgi:hypothetical protein